MSWRLEPRFLDGAHGRLHLSEWIPERPAPGRPVVVVLPPFAEEMNRSRRMLALQARQLAQHGIGMVNFDLFGTGDSAGSFGDADWRIWCSDVTCVLDDVRTRGSARIGLLGLRSGALLAASMTAPADFAPASLVLWAPVTEGHAILRQLMRLHAAAFMSAERSAAGGTSELQQRLAAGESVEIAGYRISAALAQALAGTHLNTLSRLRSPMVHWLEVVASADQQPSPAVARSAAELERDGLKVSLYAIRDEPFWSLPEITVAPSLARKTTDLLASDLCHVH